jgi:dihydrolipoamide dehydrogenase
MIPQQTKKKPENKLIHNTKHFPADVAALFHPHPSLSEAVGEAHLALAGKSLHGA